MANDKAFKVKNGLLAQRYLQSAGTETAGSVGYNLADASYDSKSFSVTSQEATPSGLAFKADGTKMYVVGSGSDTVYQYSLSTAYDLSTASYDSVSFSVAAQEATPSGLTFSSDGTKMYILGYTTSDSVYQYSLSTAYDLSTASYDSVSFSVAAQDITPLDLFFKPDGTKMYMIGNTGDDVNEYDLSTAWDISTASYLQNFSVASETTAPSGLAFSSDGNKMYVSGQFAPVSLYNLSTAWDVTTASYDQNLDVSAQEAQVTAVAINSDGTKMYVVGIANDTIYQYSTVAYTQTLDLSTGTYFSFTPSGATTVSFTNPPASGLAIGFAVEINGDGSAITWPANVKWHLATAPTATASKEIYTFITTDGGTTYYGKQAATELA